MTLFFSPKRKMITTHEMCKQVLHNFSVPVGSLAVQFPSSFICYHHHTSLIAAWGQPPVSTALILSSGNASFLTRNSQSSLKMLVKTF